jgi:hypothetical protein
MNIDWAIAVLFFIVFVVWSFVFFSGLVSTETTINTDSMTGKILDSLSVHVYSIPVIYSSPSSQSNALLQADMDWSGLDRNATRVYSGGSSLLCEISGDSLTWQSDLVAGDNNFTIEVSDNPESLNCLSSFSGQINQTIPMAREISRKTSTEAISIFTGKDYHELKRELSIENEFRISIETPGQTLVYGETPPQYADVYSQERSLSILGSGSLANLTMWIWKLNN